MKAITIRKLNCGHWVIILAMYNMATQVIDFDRYHIDTFGECLLFINGEGSLVNA